MKTRRSSTEQHSGLPPPPAPTSRDANPWQLSTPAQPVRPLGDVGHRQATAPSPGPLASHVERETRRNRPARRVPIFVIFVLAGVGVQLAFEAVQARDVGAAIGAAAFVAFAALLAWRLVRRSRR